MEFQSPRLCFGATRHHRRASHHARAQNREREVCWRQRRLVPGRWASNSVGLGPQSFGGRRTAALETPLWRLDRSKLLVRKDPDSRLCLFLYLCLAFGAPAEAGVDECTVAAHYFTELVVGDISPVAVCLASLERLDAHVSLNDAQKVGDVLA